MESTTVCRFLQEGKRHGVGREAVRAGAALPRVLRWTRQGVIDRIAPLLGSEAPGPRALVETPRAQRAQWTVPSNTVAVHPGCAALLPPPTHMSGPTPLGTSHCCSSASISLALPWFMTLRARQPRGG